MDASRQMMACRWPIVCLSDACRLPAGLTGHAVPHARPPQTSRGQRIPAGQAMARRKPNDASRSDAECSRFACGCQASASAGKGFQAEVPRGACAGAAGPAGCATIAGKNFNVEGQYVSPRRPFASQFATGVSPRRPSDGQPYDVNLRFYYGNRSDQLR